jgi:hypothetical protein
MGSFVPTMIKCFGPAPVLAEWRAYPRKPT